jgi:transcriptional regulator with XRE-family HTH domain
MASADEFDAVRRERDPLRQARRATELLAAYQQRSIELARLRREAIDRLRAERGLSYAAVAAELGLSKGRVGQIRHAAPPTERAFFGVGPVTVAIPLRQIAGRALPVISSEDETAAQRLTGLLQSLLFQVNQFRIPVDGVWDPSGDVVAICGPKNSPVTAKALQHDPVLDFHEREPGLWVIEDRETGETLTSPMDQREGVDSDIAYVGRLPVDGGTILIIAGIHALGSVGAVEYLARHLPDLYQTVGQALFSMVIHSKHDGDTVTESEAICPPRRHEARKS